MEKRKLIIAFVLSLTLILSLIPGMAFAAGSGDSEWGMFRGDKENSGKAGSKVARTAKEAIKKWSYDLKSPSAQWANISSPVIANGKIYIAADSTLYAFDKNGNKLKSEAMEASIGFTANIAYGDGKIFVPLDGRGQIQAFDADTLESLWISEPMTDAAIYHAGSVITYHNGYIYTGTYELGIDYVSTLSGNFFALSTEDADTGNKLEEKDYTWEHVPTQSGFYWAGGAVYGSSIIFAGDDGKLMSKDLTTGDDIDTYELNSPVRSSVMVSGDNAYISTNGKVYNVPMNSDGTFKKDEIKSCDTSKGQSTSSPVIHAGKLYVLSSGGFGSTGNIDVIDSKSMTKISSADLGAISQSSPLIVDTYADSSNNNTVYLYVMLNDENSDDVVVIENNDAMSKPKVSKLFSPGGSYSMFSIAADSDGTMYFVGNSSYLYAVGSKNLADPEDKPKENAVKASIDNDKSTGEETKNAAKGSSAGATGDNSVPNLWFILILVSILGLCITMLVRNREGYSKR